MTCPSLWEDKEKIMHPWVIGVDLGGTKIRLGLVSPGDEIVAVRQFATNAHAGIDAVTAHIRTAVDELCEQAPAGCRIAALGICSPGPVDHERGMLIDPPNLQGLHHAPLRQKLMEELNMPVVLEHDAKAAGLGDYYFGAGRGARSMIYIVVGTGVGAALIVDGAVYRGAHNSAGEIGHATIDRHGELCACGSRGCVETFLSGPWLGRRYEKASREDGAHAPALVGGNDVARLAAEGDPVALAVFADAGDALGAAVATLAMMLDVDFYVIGGSVAKAGDLLLEPARRGVPKYSFQSVSARVQILPTALGDDGPILGCAWLARQAA
jgi:glucokinase